MHGINNDVKFDMRKYFVVDRMRG